MLGNPVRKTATDSHLSIYFIKNFISRKSLVVMGTELQAEVTGPCLKSWGLEDRRHLVGYLTNLLP
jgi:hypothetical protein